MLNEMGRACDTCGGREMRMALWRENLKGRDYLEELGVDEGVVLRWMLKLRCGKTWSIFGFTWGQVCSCKHGNERLGFIKCGGLLDYPRKN